MPEGPEVLEYYNFIKPLLKNKILKSFNILSGKYLKKDIVNIDILTNNLPCKINRVLIKGKTIFICLNNKCSLVITHGMSGYWSDEIEKHARLSFEVGVNKLYYIDPRNFGTISICITEEEFNLRINKLGPYVLDNDITYEQFYSRLDKRPRSKIAVALLDQNLISGIGNYLRCDILWYSNINGEKRIGELNKEDKISLYDATINICRYYAELSYNLKVVPSEYNRDCYIYMEDYDIYGNIVLTKKLNGRTFHYVNTWH
jgi:formamidopyrimidine-DNA glycosylase